MPYLSEMADKSVLLCLHVQSKASKSRIVGLHDGCLKLAVASPPVDGKANKEVVRFLAAFFGVSFRDVLLKSGARSRKKKVIIKTLDATEIRNALDIIVGNGP
jgi:uncharacterized protein (TIGR00251 family)